MRYKIIFSIVIGVFSQLSQADSYDKKPFYNGHFYHLGLGSTLNLEKEAGKDLGAFMEPMIKYGYEYGFTFNNDYLYLGFELNWTIVYSRNFEGNFDDPLKPPLALWWIPISNIKLGHLLNDNKLLLSYGVIYLWGVSLAASYLVTKETFIKFETIIWLDRVFDADGAFGKGFDNAHFSLGIAGHL